MLSIAVALVAWSASVARHEWFFADDFAFLAVTQRPQNWLANFIPLGPRWWWSYRPLTTDVFFALGYKLFRQDPYGYLMMSLSMHFSMGLVVYQLGRQFGFDVRAALFTAVLSISRYASLTEGFWISISQYTVTLFFYTLSLSLFFGFARSHRIALQIASCVSMVLALLSNEMAVTLGGVIVLVSLYVGRFNLSLRTLGTTLHQTLPQLMITIVYLIFRTQIIGKADVPGIYQWTLTSEIPKCYFVALTFVFGRHYGSLWILAVPFFMAIAALVMCGDKRGTLLASLLGVSAVSLGWITLTLLPYVTMFPHPRFALPIEVPVSLLLGGAMNAFSSVYAGRHARAVEALVLGVVLLAIPYPALLDRSTQMRGAVAKQLVSLIREKHADIPKGTAVVVLSDAASESEVESFRSAVFGGAVLNAFFAEKELSLRVLKRKDLPGDLKCPPCLFLRLRDGVIEPETSGKDQTIDHPLSQVRSRPIRVGVHRISERRLDAAPSVERPLPFPLSCPTLTA